MPVRLGFLLIELMDKDGFVFFIIIFIFFHLIVCLLWFDLFMDMDRFYADLVIETRDIILGGIWTLRLIDDLKHMLFIEFGLIIDKQR